MEDAAAISPDGRRLLFVSTRSGNADIFVMPFQPENPSEAGEAANLTRHAAGDYNPAFSPDGTRILFSSSRDTSVATSSGASPAATYLASELYVMQSDGTEVRRLTRHESWDGAPAWTPDGEAVVFYSQRDGEPRIYRTGIDGAAPEPISAEGEAALSPVPVADGPARVHGAPRRPLDPRHHPARRVRSADRERCRPRLLGAGVRSGLGPPRRAWAGTGRWCVPVRERRAGGVSHPPACPRGPAGPPRVPDRNPGLSAGDRSHLRRGRHQRSFRPPCGVQA